MERIELCCRTNLSNCNDGYSLLEGISSVEEYIDKAIERGCNTIGITDKSSIRSFIKAQKYIEKIGNKDFKIIYGIRVNLYIDQFMNKLDINSEDKSIEIIIYVKTQEGLKNLYKLLSNANYKTIDGERCFGIYKEIFVDKDLLDKYRDGLLFGIKGNSLQSLGYEVCLGVFEFNFKYFDFIEIEPIYNINKVIELPSQNGWKESREFIKKQIFNKHLIEIGKENNILVIASNMPLFVDKEDDICCQIYSYSKANFLSNEHCYKNDERYLKTTNEMLEEFNYLEKELAYDVIVNNTNKLANIIEKVNVINTSGYFPKIEENPCKNKKNQVTYFREKFGKDKIIYGRCEYQMPDFIPALYLPSQRIERFIKDWHITLEENKKNYILNKIRKIKPYTSFTNEVIIILPPDIEITDFCPIEINDEGNKETHIDYRDLFESGLWIYRL